MALVGLLSATGVAFAQTFTESGSVIFNSAATYNAFSASAADIDNDGDLDLLFQGSLSNTLSPHALWRNELAETGTLTFTDITSTSGVFASDTAGWSAAWGDYDGDDDVDVFLGEANPGAASGDLFLNNGDETFTNISNSAGVADPGFAQNVAWADADRDGDLDLFIIMEGPQPHELYVQDFATKTFTQSGSAVGLQVPYGIKGYGTAVGDVDGDGYPDLYVSTCNGQGDAGNIRNNFFMNRTATNGSLLFEDMADSNGTQFMLNSYGCEFVDLDDDGDLDLYLTGSDENNSKIWRNDGAGVWTDIDTVTGHSLLSDTGTDLNGSKAVDYDNDGDLDLFFHNNLGGLARKLYRNDGNWEFTDVTVAEGLHESGRGAYDSVWADFDRDGDMDLVAPTGSSTPERFFRSNASGNGNHWLHVRLRQAGSNSTAIGSQVYVTTDPGLPGEKTRRREANTNIGTFNQSDLPVHFGLGGNASPVTVRVKWPDGSWQTASAIAVDQYITIVKGPVDSPTPTPSPSPTLSPTSSPSPSPSETPSPTISPTASSTPSPTSSPSPTDSPTPTPGTPTPTPSFTATPSVTPNPTDSPTPSVSPTGTGPLTSDLWIIR
ncbi:CRTAC1 family protein [Candidatus Sumerlaeota bacterium]|nr:CRTAC1 family protein [Candidatus Sumerlaeota bacterium]